MVIAQQKSDPKKLCISPNGLEQSLQFIGVKLHEKNMAPQENFGQDLQDKNAALTELTEPTTNNTIMNYGDCSTKVRSKKAVSSSNCLVPSPQFIGVKLFATIPPNKKSLTPSVRLPPSSGSGGRPVRQPA
ncbi:MAG: hypothetical protein GXO76_10860 [Calditrichaeota bacterium]|nr:hypothetical protein [Calditrichota bacterium]